MEKRDNPIGYRPSDKVKELFEKYCGHDALMSKTQLIEVAFKYLLSVPHEDLDTIIWQLLSGKSEKQAPKKKASNQ